MKEQLNFKDKPLHPNSEISAAVIHGKAMLATPDPVIDNPKAKGRYLTKYSLTATVAELKTNPEPAPEQENIRLVLISQVNINTTEGSR